VGITAGSRAVPGRNACDRRQPYNNNNNNNNETIDHTISECPILAKEQYIKIYSMSTNTL